MFLLVFLVAGSLGPGVALAAEPVIHTVVPGDTLSGIAEHYDVTVDALAAANGLTERNLIRVGQRLTIPGADSPAIHLVIVGDNIFRIAERYGVSVEAILEANNLIDPELIVVGQRLVIPGESASVTYRVVAGDSLMGIAERYGISVEAILQANSLSDPGLIVVGQDLTIPSADQVADAAAPAPAAVPAPSDGSYAVSEGETLYRIAAHFGVSVGELAQVNGLRNPNAIRAGQTLIVPTRRARQLSTRGGTRPAATAAPASQPGDVFQVTYYCLQGRMSSGRWVYDGAAAADTSVLPLGTRIQVAGLGDFTIEDRFAVDLGRKRVDIWTESCAEALARGFEYRQVTVVE